MKHRLLGAAAAVALTLGLGLAAEAKTLVYCSEASPEGFSPQLWDTGTTLDVVRPVFNTLVDFEFGTTNLQAALAEKWEVSDDALTYTFHLRKGVSFHSSKTFSPTRDFNADDRSEERRVGKECRL